VINMKDEIGLSSIEYDVEIMLNYCGYNGSNIDFLRNEIEPDYFIDKDLKIGMKYAPSAVDWQQIWVTLFASKDVLLVAFASGLATKLGEELYLLLKKTLMTKTTVEKAEPIVQINFHVDNLNITIDGIDENNVSKLKSNKFWEYLTDSIELDNNNFESIDDVVDDNINSSEQSEVD
jgi:hypothetical protein